MARRMWGCTTCRSGWVWLGRRWSLSSAMPSSLTARTTSWSCSSLFLAKYLKLFILTHWPCECKMTTVQIFRPKHLIKELASMIKHNERGERLFVDDKRCHRNDGLIFTPCMFCSITLARSLHSTTSPSFTPSIRLITNLFSQRDLTWYIRLLI